MNAEFQFLLVAGILSAVAIMLSLVTLLKNRRQQQLLDLEVEKIELLEETLAESQGLLESSQQAVSEHARRIAWLDARIRKIRYVSVKSNTNSNPVEERKSNIDEKRDRVLTLAASGQDTGTIAATLGMMPGEVELMLSLNNHSAALA